MMVLMHFPYAKQIQINTEIQEKQMQHACLSVISEPNDNSPKPVNV